MAGKRIPIEHRKWLAGPELRRLGIKCTDTILRQRRRIEMREWKESYVRAYSNPRRRGTYLYLVEDVKLLYKYADKSADRPFVEDNIRWCPVRWLETDPAKQEDLFFPMHLPIQWIRSGKLTGRELLVQVGGNLLGWVMFVPEHELRAIKNVEKNLPIERRAVKIQRGRLRGRVILRRQVKRAKPQKSVQEKTAAAPPATVAVTLKAAESLAGVSRRRLTDWLNEGFELPGGKRIYLKSLGDIEIEVGGPHGQRVMSVEHVDRPSLDQIIQERAKPKESGKTPCRDDQGVWYRGAYLKSQHGWYRKMLAEFRTCWLSLNEGKQVVRPFKMIPPPIGSMTHKKEWGYHSQVMDRIGTAVDEGQYKTPKAALAADPALGAVMPTSGTEEELLTKILKAAEVFERRPSEQPSKQPNKPGRKSLRDEKASRRTEALSAWDRAKTAGTSVKDFCNDWNAEHRDNLLSAETIKKYQSWRAMQRSRSRG